MECARDCGFLVVNEDSVDSDYDANGIYFFDWLESVVSTNEEGEKTFYIANVFDCHR